MPKPEMRPGPSDGDIFRRAIGIGLVGVGLATVAASLGGPGAKVKQLVGRLFNTPAHAEVHATTAPTHLSAAPISDEARKKGYHECNPPDPVGLGPYAPYRNLSMGRIAIPQRGGHTEDMGYDVLIHFHGHEPVRKTVAQVARGVTYVGIDRGVGSGRYSDAFPNPDVFNSLVRSIDATLKTASGDPRAHIRHLALSAWSAGYGAVNEILKYGDERVDAVILLDGLHAAWNPAAPSHDAGVSSLSSLPLRPTFRFAKKALAGEKIFLFTHSQVVPDGYPSTRQTADLLLHELDLTRTPVDPAGEHPGQTGSVDQKGFHLWSFAGHNEFAHCTHISYITRALYLIEDAWDTPAMDRTVPFTPAPQLGAGANGMDVALVGAADASAPSEPALAGNSLAAALTPPPPSEPELLPHPGGHEVPAPATAEPAPRAPAPAPAASAP